MKFKILTTAILLMFSLIVAEAQVIELTVVQIDNTVFNPGKATLFDAKQMVKVQATTGSKTTFGYELYGNPGDFGQQKPETIIVSESYSAVKAKIASSYPSEAVQTKWLLLDATGGKATGTYNLVDPVTLLPWSLPNKAIVIGGFYDTQTTFTSSTDAATIALGITTDFAAGLKAAIAISNGANPWDAGRAAIIPVGTAATHVGPTTAERTVIATVAVENLTAGVLKLNLQYVVRP